MGGYDPFMEEVEENYHELVTFGVPDEDARMVLPNACCASLYLSCNLRELIHICNERLCSKAQWEIRELVQEMVKLIDPELQFVLVPKCKSGRIICNSPCGRCEEELHDTEERIKWCEDHCDKCSVADCWLHYFEIEYTEQEV